MQLRKMLLIGLTIFLSGCSLISKKNNIINISSLPDIKKKFTPTQKWKNSIFEGISKSFYHPSSTCQGNRIYAADRRGFVKAIDAGNGEVIWSTNIVEKNAWCSHKTSLLSGVLGVSGSKVFLGSERALVYALNSMNGTKLWKTKVAGEVISRPVVTDNLVLIHTTNGMLQALQESDGAIKWTVNLGTPTLTLRGESAPAIVHGAAIVGGDNGYVSAVLLKNGRIIWQQYIAELIGSTEIKRIRDVDTTPIVVNDIVYTLGYNGNFASLDLRSGHIQWKYPMSSVHDFIVDSDRIYIIDQDDCILSLSTDGGALLWKQPDLFHRKLTTPVLYNKSLVVGDSAGYLYKISTDDAHFIAKEKVDSSGILSVLLSNSDTLIVQARSGKFYAFTQ
ncbi:outer membrane protein assembly factor BamB [Candidatus Profftia tarda]|uniref:Outer membrane protein assembly factor BamB n=1 Tax=Candidatus Profftia tarda TaxID=1177216 RepID=A0A8E4EZ52_9ENTR|nr:outer membrane protein assembly factor BamB [Candidatus Profftia tarda]CAD6512538.1 Outer membrane protein assembly factor BamB [Candidatus Profftia tarda]